MPDGGLVGAVVSPGSALATGRCAGPSTGSTCQPTQNPAADPMSVNLTVPRRQRVGDGRADPGARPGRSRRRPQRRRQRGAGPRRQPGGRHRSSGDDHLALLAGGRDGHPARRGPGRAHDRRPPAGVASQLRERRPAQRSVELRAAARSTRNGQNTFVTVLTTQTSRWRVRRSLPVENQGAPTRATGRHGQGGQALRRLGPEHLVDGARRRAVPAQWRRTACSSTAGSRPRRPARRWRSRTPGPASTRSRSPPSTRPAEVPGDGRRSRWPRCPSLARWRPSAERPAPRSTVTVEWKAPADAGGFTLKKYKVAIYKKAAEGGHREASAKKRQAESLKLDVGQVHLPGPRQEHRQVGSVEQEATRSGRADSEQPRALSAR